MRTLFSLAIMAAVSLTSVPAAQAQEPTSYDVVVSGEEAMAYARRLEGDVSRLEESLSSLRKRIPSNLSSRLTAVETGLKELKAAAIPATPGTEIDLQPLLARLTALEAVVAAIPATPEAPNFEGWRTQFESSAASWRQGIEERLQYVEDDVDDLDRRLTALERGVRTWRLALTAEVAGALHPRELPAATVQTPDNVGGGLNVEFRAPLPARPSSYVQFCPSAGGRYASGLTVGWRAEAAFCLGHRYTAADVGVRLGAAYSGNILGIGGVTQAGDFHGVMGDLGVELTPATNALYLSAGARAGGGVLRLDQTGTSPAWAGGSIRIEPYLQVGAMF